MLISLAADFFSPIFFLLYRHLLLKGQYLRNRIFFYALLGTVTLTANNIIYPQHLLVLRFITILMYPSCIHCLIIVFLDLIGFHHRRWYCNALTCSGFCVRFSASIPPASGRIFCCAAHKLIV